MGACVPLNLLNQRFGIFLSFRSKFLGFIFWRLNQRSLLIIDSFRFSNRPNAQSLGNGHVPRYQSAPKHFAELWLPYSLTSKPILIRKTICWIRANHFALLELKPIALYNGYEPMIAGSSIPKPTNPHQDCAKIPMRMIVAPNTIRMILSILPTFFFIRLRF